MGEEVAYIYNQAQAAALLCSERRPGMGQHDASINSPQKVTTSSFNTIHELQARAYGGDKML